MQKIIRRNQKYNLIVMDCQCWLMEGGQKTMNQPMPKMKKYG